MLVIDELHNILAGCHDQQREFLNVLRFLGNELKIRIVGVGKRDERHEEPKKVFNAVVARS